MFGWGKKDTGSVPEVEIGKMPYLKVELTMAGQKVNLVNEQGDYLVDLQDRSTSSRKNRSGKVSLPALTDEELKIQTARTDLQTL